IAALEMAQQLHQQGEAARLVIFDTALAGTLADPDEDPGEEVAVVRLLARGLEALAGMPREAALTALERLPDGDARLAFLLEQARRAKTVPPEFGIEEVRPLLRVVESSSRAWRRYHPRPYPGRVLLVRTPEPPGLRPGDPTLGWAGIAGELDMEIVPGQHHQFLLEPSVGAVGERVRAWLAR
ncbi:MAG TPA: hypothetical protein VNO33_15945, partial [Kofleriaceae bacterium]|nr:hypothetical protein [Kofleriaceae bacterium]